METITHTSQATRRRQEAQETKEIICRMIEIDAQTYAEMQYNCAISYLHFMGADEVFMNELENNKKFWAWWRNAWFIRDENFLREQEAKSGFAVSDAGELVASNDDPYIEYLSMNNPYNLASGLTTDGQILQTSYAKMIGNVIDELTEKSY
jgi:hypothetical protein